jgi:hypothetical protein
MIPVLLAFLMAGAVLALTNPAPSSRMDRLPRPIVELQRSWSAR